MDFNHALIEFLFSLIYVDSNVLEDDRNPEYIEFGSNLMKM